MSTLLHAKYGASSSDRWIGCPASTALIKQAPPQKGSAYAQEGTDAHSCLEALLKTYIMSRGNPAKVAATRTMLSAKFPEAMIAHAHDAFTWITKRRREIESEVLGVRSIVELLCETRVDLPVSEPGQFGTVDAALVELFGRLVVIDFKYGAGVPVFPENNSQLIYYALGLAHRYDYNFSEVEIVIIQPRAEVEGHGTVRSWVTTVETLHEWREKFEAGIQASKDPCAPYASGKWCRWCPAASICPELSDRALKQAQIDFEPVDGALALPALQGIAIPNLPAILNAADRIEDWIAKVREHAADVLERGEKIPGWKLVAKRSTRKWVDMEKVAKAAQKKFGVIAFSEPELLSPAQLEKALKGMKKDVLLSADAFITENTSNVSSGTTMVQETDPRPAVNLVEQDFAAISDESGTTVKEKGGNMATKKKTTKKKKTAKK